MMVLLKGFEYYSGHFPSLLWKMIAMKSNSSDTLFLHVGLRLFVGLYSFSHDFDIFSTTKANIRNDPSFFAMIGCHNYFPKGLRFQSILTSWNKKSLPMYRYSAKDLNIPINKRLPHLSKFVKSDWNSVLASLPNNPINMEPPLPHWLIPIRLMWEKPVCRGLSKQRTPCCDISRTEQVLEGSL